MEIDTEYVEVKRSIFPKSLMSDLNISVYNLPQKKLSPLSSSCNSSPRWNSDQDNKIENKLLKRNDGFYILANKVNISKHLKKTKFCNILIQEGSCDRKVCNFAHTVDEYNFPCCAFGNNCKINNCKFKHPCENLDIYKTRINFKFPQNIK